MNLIRHLDDYSILSNGLVMTIGNFDGVHLGHRKLLRYTSTLATKYSLTPSVMFFHPHTRDETYITSLREKLHLLSECGIKQFFILNMREMRHIEADIFLEKLKSELGAKILVVGKDFRFGKDRKGDVILLKSHIKTYSIPKLLHFSSSEIRRILATDLVSASSMLGCPYHIIGRVVHGLYLASSLGFPTANVEAQKLVPISGVFFSRAYIDGIPYYAATNIGFTPTIASKKQKIETHILDFSGNLYGKYIKIELLEKIRDEIKFESLEALKSQIAKDVARCKSMIS